ncbi:hypothetical protein G6011_05996 [Alternaria panax]|uniref:Uncharacterized protein n=1 Tax=Alternaria panax TaxID=48097 RepID=A0AAD4FFP4_9PLEO|nr:hypothetical protein G6011_05996 [Alternaria panax]
MATPKPNRRTFARPSRAQSIQSTHSESPFDTPRPTPPPPTQRLGRGVRANSNASDVSSPTVADTTTDKGEKKAGAKLLPRHYFLPPTFPSPFEGNPEKSLDAIQEWGRLHAVAKSEIGTDHKGIQPIIDALLRPVDNKTDWPFLLQHIQPLRYLLEELLFLLTRTLLPEQIVQNRNLMARLYNAKKQLAMRLMLRYDMLREWKMKAGTHHRGQAVTVASEPPLLKGVPVPAPIALSREIKKKYPFRRPLLPNIIATIITAPSGGFSTHGVRERMKHHVTDLDAYLLLEDEEVARWGGMRLLVTLCQVILQWQWLRQNNAVLDEMEVHGWEELEGKADDSEWIAEDVKRNIAGGGSKRERAVVKEED